ncbi:MAG TPA: hypothetical protein VFS50_03535 [Meiothermus sp.]|jgi:hypothetical protein|nr:hypothetical protein [Meiothermus sp.]
MIRFPDDRIWQVEEWIFRGFLEDARPHLKEVPELAKQVHRVLDAAQPVLDLRGAGQKSLRELKLLVMLVRRDNLKFKGRNFADPAQFPVYLNALEDLLDLVTE